MLAVTSQLSCAQAAMLRLNGVAASAPSWRHSVGQQLGSADAGPIAARASPLQHVRSSQALSAAAAAAAAVGAAAAAAAARAAAAHARHIDLRGHKEAGALPKHGVPEAQQQAHAPVAKVLHHTWQSGRPWEGEGGGACTGLVHFTQ